MRSQAIVILVGLLLQAPFAAAESFTAKCISVSDGDTITVLHNGRTERIRLSGIDCPEKRQAFGQQAKQFTAAAVFGKEVSITTFGKDRYGRSIGDVTSPEGINVNADLVENGLAWHYVRFDHQQKLDDLEKAARERRRGLWSDSSPIPPWEYRKSHH